MIASLRSLGRKLRRTPVKPTSVAALLGRHESYLAFRRVVRELFPEAEAEILSATESGGSRENARVWAFSQRFEAEYFPVYELEEYDQIAYGIPFARNAWDFDRLHELDLPKGELLLFALCSQPYDTDYDSRVPLLDACEAHVPRGVLTEIPEGGFAPAQLHERLDDTPYAAAALYADWLWAETDTVFLDVDDDMTADIEWTHDNVLELMAQWQRAEGILNRIGELADWLAQDAPERFTQLLDAALGRDARLNYEQTRRLYACEITEHGVVPVPRDEPEPVALPLVVSG